ncbi:Mitochondrial Carrier (MC) Family [Thraustotheca clavata]|uniref:Mitochondrial Carrier (MC) Family n=1 Tax=Thraustotheca clavata TaxID=74557 RepID=A0A1W0AAZ5_9STRA|nr:Mitochondrial Carrier (MC) Family [Thraustotheca clavata]
MSADERRGIVKETSNEEEFNFTWTMENLKLYNPDFDLTPEVLAILKQFFMKLDPTDSGKISGAVLIEKVRQADPSQIFITAEQLEQLTKENVLKHPTRHKEDGQDVWITFDEFCELVMRWKAISPLGVQMVYASWVKEVCAIEFGLVNETDGMFIIEIPRLPNTEEKMKVRVTLPRTNTYLPPAPHLNDLPPSPSTPKSATTPTDHVTTVSKSFAVGGLAGMISKSILAPVDRVKVLFQVTESLTFSLRNALKLGMDIAVRDGATALFRGNSLNLLRVFPYAGIQHSSFDFVRRKFHAFNHESHQALGSSLPYTKKLSNTQLILSGSIAGGASVIFTYPMDVLRTRYMVQQGKIQYNSVFDAVRCMYRTDGLRSFSRGLFVNLLGIVPYTGIGFTLNEIFKQYLADVQYEQLLPDMHREKYVLSPFSKFLCSYIAGSFAQTVTYPLDTIRKRIQSDGYITGSKERKYTNLRTTCRIIFQHEGLRGFYKGATVTWLRGPLSTGISLTAYDVLKEIVGVETV